MVNFPRNRPPSVNGYFGLAIFDILWDLSRECWNTNGESRPTAQHLRDRLQFEVLLRESFRKLEF